MWLESVRVEYDIVMFENAKIAIRRPILGGFTVKCVFRRSDSVDVPIHRFHSEWSVLNRIVVVFHRYWTRIAQT